MFLTKIIWMLAQGVLLALAAERGVADADEVLPRDNPRACFCFSIDAALAAEQSGGGFAFTRVIDEQKNTACFASSVDFDSFVFSGNLTARPDVVEVSLGANHRETQPASAYLQAFENLPSQSSRVTSPFGKVHRAYIIGSGLVALSTTILILKLVRRVRGIENEGIEHEAVAA